MVRIDCLLADREFVGDKWLELLNENNVSTLSGEDVAVVLLDEVEYPKHHQERFTAAY